MRTFIPKDVKLIPPEAKRVFQGVIYDVYQWPQEMFDGSTATFEMLKRPDTVRVLAIKDDKIVVQEQEQPHAGFFYDLPSGRHDIEAEDELAAAQRELLEETGMAFNTWKLIQAFQPHTKIEWLVYTFLATDFESEVPQKLDAGEKITVTLKTLDEIKALLEDPNARYLAKDIFESTQIMDELFALPDIRI